MTWHQHGDWLTSATHGIARKVLHHGRVYTLYDFEGDDTGMTFVGNFESADEAKRAAEKQRTT